MKKFAIILLSAVMMLCAFTSCGTPKEWKENVNETFESLPAYTNGSVTSAVFESGCNVKIEDDSYDHFVKYIKTLKSNGFKYCPISGAPENYENNNGAASWRGTDGKIWLQLIFNESSAPNYSMFGCNVQIYGYTAKPSGWDDVEEEKKDDEKKDEKETTKSDKKKDDKKETKKSDDSGKGSTKAEKTTEKATKKAETTKADK